MVDVTDATFETDVIEASHQAAIVVDLWAEWCGPCKTLGPILEKVIAETNGKVVLAKVDVDANPATSQAFQVQSIPAVYAMKDGKVVNGFVGAQGEPAVREFVQSLMPTDAELQIEQLLAVGDEESLLKVLELVPDHHVAVPAVAELLIARGENEMALELLQKVPETAEVRRIAAMARIGGEAPIAGAPVFSSPESAGAPADAAGDAAPVSAPVDDGMDAKLTALLDRVKTDDEARQQYVDLLEVMGPEDPRTADYRKQLSMRLF